ncbi:MAG TPA: hypothetical protein VM935_04720 [Chitinophagaceae bacterium]|nr:hypothetical protein [Chitinophagaceae bacterium]
MPTLRFTLLFVFSLFFGIMSCKKQETLIAPAAAGFTATTTTATYFIQNTPGSVYKIPIGVTSASKVDRTINFTVTSPTGAVAGSQYTVTSSSVTIPAGKVVDSISVKGLFAGYAIPGRRDTLVFTITGGDITPSSYANVFKLVLLKSCDVVAANLIGNYANSTDTYNGAASTRPNYNASISGWTPMTATSATVIFKNIGATSDNGWGPFSAADGSLNPGITATLSWSDPGNQTISIASQNYFNDGTGNSTITGTGSFSSCDQTFTIVANVKYAGNGNTYTHISTLKR